MLKTEQFFQKFLILFTVMAVPSVSQGSTFVEFFKDLAGNSREVKAHQSFISQSNINRGLDEAKYKPHLQINTIYSGNKRKSLQSSVENKDGVLSQDRKVIRKLRSGTQIDLNFRGVDLYQEDKGNSNPGEQGPLPGNNGSSALPKDSEASLKLTISQALWQNSFGSNWRRESLLANKHDYVEQLNAYLKIESWFGLAMAKFFTIARKFIDLKDAEKKLSYSKRILDSAKSRYNYGDLRQKELFEAEADYLTSSIALNNKEFEFYDEIDNYSKQYFVNKETLKKAVLINNIVKNATSLGSYDCDAFAPHMQSNTELEILRHKNEVNSLKTSIAKDYSRPKLDLLLSAETTGVGESRLKAIEEMDRGAPLYEVGLLFSMPLGGSSYKHEERKLMRDKLDMNSNLKTRESELTIEYETFCRQRDLNNSNIRLKKQSLELTRKKFRISLDDFERGNISTSELSREANELMQQETSLYYSMIDISYAYFQLMLIEGKVEKIL